MDRKRNGEGIIEGLIGRLKYLCEVGITELALPQSEKGKGLKTIGEEVLACKKCLRHKERENAVRGRGNPGCAVIFAGGAPSEEDSKAGRPFTGKEGEQLTRMIKSMGLNREDVYVTNIIRCAGRPPTPEEFSMCISYFEREIDVIGPRVVISLGDDAARILLSTKGGVEEVRGRFHSYRGVKLMATHEPAILLKRQELKRDTWQDIQMVMGELKK